MADPSFTCTAEAVITANMPSGQLEQQVECLNQGSTLSESSDGCSQVVFTELVAVPMHEDSSNTAVPIETIPAVEDADVSKIHPSATSNNDTETFSVVSLSDSRNPVEDKMSHDLLLPSISSFQMKIEETPAQSDVLLSYSVKPSKESSTHLDIDVQEVIQTSNLSPVQTNLSSPSEPRAEGELSVYPSEHEVVADSSAVELITPGIPVELSNMENTITKPKIQLSPIKPARNKLLMSQLLSTDEIVKEVIEQAEKKRPPQIPEGGDLLFQKQLTKRLANKVIKESLVNNNNKPIVQPVVPQSPPVHGIVSSTAVSPSVPVPLTASTTPRRTNNRSTTDLDAQKLLSILEDGAESHYCPPPSTEKKSRQSAKLVHRPEVDRQMERELALKQLMEVSRTRKRKSEGNNNHHESDDASGGKTQRRLTELQRLLQDEGAINMLYDIEKGDQEKSKVLPSKRRAKKALQKKAQEVTAALLGGVSSPGGGPTKTKPRLRKLDSPLAEASKIVRRHSSSSSYSSRGSSPSRRNSVDHEVTENGCFTTEPVGVDSSAPPEVIIPNLFDEKLKETSKIDQISESHQTPTTAPTTAVSNTSSSKRTLSSASLKAPATNITAVSSSPNASGSSPETQNGFKEKLQSEFTNKFKKIMVKKAILSVKREQMSIETAAVHHPLPPSMAKPQQAVKPSQQQQKHQSTKQSIDKASNAVWKMLQDDWALGDDPDDPAPISSTPIKPASNNSSTPSAPSTLSPSVKVPSSIKAPRVPATQIKTEIAPLPPTEPEVELPADKNEVPFTHHLGIHTYKELLIRKIGPLVHINIAPVSTILPQAFNIQVLKELTRAVGEISNSTSICNSLPNSNTNCKAILLTCSSNVFSAGVDLPALLHDDQQTRATVAREMSQAIKDFVYKIAMVRKPVIAGVIGPCIGLGVATLAYCDLVYATDSAVFSMPHGKLGYIAEAAATLTLPIVVGHRIASSMLMEGRKLSATEALSYGLLSDILPEEGFMSAIVERAYTVAMQSSQSMESSKVMMMHNIRSRLSSVLTTETTLLQQQWLTLECQARIKDHADKLLSAD